MLQSVSVHAFDGRKLVVHIEEYEPAFDVLAELTVDSQFDPEREAEVFEWIAGLLDVPADQIQAAHILTMDESGPSARGRSLYTARIEIHLCEEKPTNKYTTVNDENWQDATWQAAALPAPGFGGEGSVPLWHYASRARTDTLYAGLHRLAQLWVDGGGKASVVPWPGPLTAHALEQRWPLAAEIEAVLEALQQRSQLCELARRTGRPLPSMDALNQATAVLAAALAASHEPGGG